MGDRTENIFLNARAADNTDDKELAVFLRYVHSGLVQNAFMQEIDDETKRVRSDTKWRERIMTWEMDLRIMEKRFLEKGRRTEREEIARVLREDYSMSEEQIAEIKAKVAARNETQNA